MFRSLIWTILLACAAMQPARAQDASPVNEVFIESPNQSVRFRLSLDQGQLMQEMAFRGLKVIEPSPIRVTLDEAELTSGVQITSVERYELRETYPWRGVHGHATNHCHGALIFLEAAGAGLRYTLEVRAFNDAAAFRYLIPGGERARVPEESSSFKIPNGSTVWYHGLRGHYEGVHERKEIESVQAGQWAAPPLTIRLPGGAYAAITEAALFNYSGMALQADGAGAFNLVLGHKHPVSYPFELRYKDDIERMSRPAAISGDITSPWRVVLVGSDLHTLVTSDAIHNLSPPPDAALFPEGIRTDWVRPGRAVWRYLDGGDRSLQGIKEFSRWAGELGFQYQVVEGFWSRWSEEEIRELVTYSREQGVGLWFWKHSQGLRTPEARREFFRQLQDFGVVGAKIDFFDHEHREVVNLYQALLEEAAKHKIMVNFHGSKKPTGEARTWPNELTRESVRGMEASSLRERARHNTTIPFTRYLAGHGDYTPVHFGSRRADTTWAHQIATAVIFNDHLLTYAAHPTNILSNPALPMIKSIPAVWEQTIVLPVSQIGEIAAFARRSGDDWFLAVLNGPEQKRVDLPLSFLQNGRYSTLLVRDHPSDAANVRMERLEAQRDGSLTIDLSEGGGLVARFVRERASAETRQPRVFLLDGDHLRRVRERLRAGDAELSVPLGKLNQDARQALDAGPFSVTYKTVTPPSGNKHDYMSQAPYWWPNPRSGDGLPYVRRDGERNPEIDKISDRHQLGTLAGTVETLALAYFFTGEDAYAVKAAELIRTWFLDASTRMNPHLEYGQGIPGITTGRGIGLIETRAFARIVDAVGMIEESNSWSQSDQDSLREWFERFLAWMIESRHGRDEAAARNNHGTYYDLQVASYALFVGKDQIARTILSQAGPNRIATQIEPDGRQLLELDRTRAWSYSIGNLEGLIALARLGKHVGVDLWSFETADGRSLSKAVDYLVPYALGDRPWPYPEIGRFSPEACHHLLRRVATSSPIPKYRQLLTRIPGPRPDARAFLLELPSGEEEWSGR